MLESRTWEVSAFSASSAWLAHITAAAQNAFVAQNLFWKTPQSEPYGKMPVLWGRERSATLARGLICASGGLRYSTRRPCRTSRLLFEINFRGGFLRMVTPILSGFPTPEILEEYEKQIPGFGRILVEEVIKHRQALERAEENAHSLAMRQLEIEANTMRRGQWCGLAIGIVAILAGSATAAFGAALGTAIAGGFIGGGGVIGLVSVFLAQNRNTSRLAQNRDTDRRTLAVDASLKP
jgi:hypothetical protein